ncbi:hypothetical protein ASD21_10815 [Caulobacter sp. Root1455]|uniref:hypothetical protein n=1 Tax=unclassified Caulobacter TaxID=2648921 RepID=UPI0006F339A7|nr:MULTISPECIES: hypothetical protein [unclassified Caulobacter]KQY35277.1 hypothetical protein ASD38_01540 [Caulobacter sp. Root487D2Y]KQY93253.1 hypothetical protein ASD21_10815 [Caulobacter sp. Root1455]
MLQQLINVAADGDGWRVSRQGDTLLQTNDYGDAMAFATSLAEQSDGGAGVVVEGAGGEVESQQYVGPDSLPWGQPEAQPEPQSAEADPMETILEHAMPVEPSKSA